MRAIQALCKAVLFSCLLIPLHVYWHSASAQPLPLGCQSDLVSESKALAYGYTKRSSSYCDGIVPVKNRGELQIVSFTAGPIRFAGATLPVRRAIGSSGTLYLVGLDKLGTRSYRLDGTLPADGIAIDLAPVIIPSSLAADDLGLFAWTESGGNREFFPVAANAQADPTATGAELVFRTAVALVQAKAQICEVDGTCGSPTVLGSNILQGSIVSLPIRRNGGVARTMSVMITALVPGRPQSTITFAVRVP